MCKILGIQGGNQANMKNSTIIFEVCYTSKPQNEGPVRKKYILAAQVSSISDKADGQKMAVDLGRGRFFSYNAQPPYKMGHQIKFWVPQLLGHKIGLLRCPRPILGWISPF